MCFIDKSDSVTIVNALKLFLNRRERERLSCGNGCIQKGYALQRVEVQKKRRTVGRHQKVDTIVLRDSDQFVRLVLNGKTLLFAMHTGPSKFHSTQR